MFKPPIEIQSSFEIEQTPSFLKLLKNQVLNTGVKYASTLEALSNTVSSGAEADYSGGNFSSQTELPSTSTIGQDFSLSKIFDWEKFQANLTKATEKYAPEYRERFEEARLAHGQASFIKRFIPEYVAPGLDYLPLAVISPMLGISRFATAGLGANLATRIGANAIEFGAASTIVSEGARILGLEEKLRGEPVERFTPLEEFAIGAGLGAGFTAAGEVIKPIARFAFSKLNSWFESPKATTSFSKKATESLDEFFEQPSGINKEYNAIEDAMKFQSNESNPITFNIPQLREPFYKRYEEGQRSIFKEAQDKTLTQLKALEEKQKAGLLGESEQKTLEELSKKSKLEFRLDELDRMEKYNDHVQAELTKLFEQDPKNVRKQADFIPLEEAKFMTELLQPNTKTDLTELLPKNLKDEKNRREIFDAIINNKFEGLNESSYLTAKGLESAWQKIPREHRLNGNPVPNLKDYVYMGWDPVKVKSVPREVFLGELEAGAKWGRMKERAEQSLEFELNKIKPDTDAIESTNKLLKNMETREGRLAILNGMRDSIITESQHYEIAQFFSRRRQTVMNTYSKFFFFKDGKSYDELLSKYGYGGNAVESIHMGMKSAARSLSVARVLGGNGMKVIGDFLKGKDTSKGTLSSIQRFYTKATEPLGDPATGILYQTYKALRNLSSATKLGFITKFALTEEPIRMGMVAKERGMGGLKNFSLQFKKMGYSKEDMKKLLHFTSVTRDYFGNHDFISNKEPLSKLRDFVMKIQGIHQVTRRNQHVAALNWQIKMAEFFESGTTWENLPKDWKIWAQRDGLNKNIYDTILNTYGIGIVDINTINHFVWQNVYNATDDIAVKAAADAFGSAQISFQKNSVIEASRISAMFSLMGRPVILKNPGDILQDAFFSLTGTPLQIFYYMYEKDFLKRSATYILPTVIAGLAVKELESLARGETITFDPEEGRGASWHMFDAWVKGGGIGLPADLAWHIGGSLIDAASEDKDVGQQIRKAVESSLVGAPISTGTDPLVVLANILQGRNDSALKNATRLIPANNNPLVHAAIHKYALHKLWEYTEDGGYRQLQNEMKTMHRRGTEPLGGRQ